MGETISFAQTDVTQGWKKKKKNSITFLKKYKQKKKSFIKTKSTINKNP